MGASVIDFPWLFTLIEYFDESPLSLLCLVFLCHNSEKFPKSTWERDSSGMSKTAKAGASRLETWSPGLNTCSLLPFFLCPIHLWILCCARYVTRVLPSLPKSRSWPHPDDIASQTRPVQQHVLQHSPHRDSPQVISNIYAVPLSI
jgi:hypothetical protein